MCKIHLPEWISADYLKSLKEREKTEETFQELPYHYMEISQLILDNFSDEIEEADKLKALLKDLEDIRADRIRAGIETVAKQVQEGEQILSVNLNNTGSLEILSIKRFFLESMEMFRNLTTYSSDRMSGVGQTLGGDPPTGPSGAPGRSLRRYRQN